MKVLQAYEYEAARFGMQLLHESGVTALDQWYSDFVETDWTYVERYYQTNSLPDWTTCVASGQPLVPAAPIPPSSSAKSKFDLPFSAPVKGRFQG
jgi:hypothetical protein